MTKNIQSIKYNRHYLHEMQQLQHGLGQHGLGQHLGFGQHLDLQGQGHGHGQQHCG
jgi:hypothetical protein